MTGPGRWGGFVCRPRSRGNRPSSERERCKEGRPDEGDAAQVSGLERSLTLTSPGSLARSPEPRESKPPSNPVGRLSARYEQPATSTKYRHKLLAPETGLPANVPRGRPVVKVRHTVPPRSPVGRSIVPGRHESSLPARERSGGTIPRAGSTAAVGCGRGRCLTRDVRFPRGLPLPSTQDSQTPLWMSRAGWWWPDARLAHVLTTGPTSTPHTRDLQRPPRPVGGQAVTKRPCATRPALTSTRSGPTLRLRSTWMATRRGAEAVAGRRRRRPAGSHTRRLDNFPAERVRPAADNCSPRT